MALLLVALGAPLGSFTLVLTLMVGLAALPLDQWRFLPAALPAGALTDLLVRSVGPGLRGRVGAAALPALASLGGRQRAELHTRVPVIPGQAACATMPR